jgi:CheY-like chemotaxis protein
LINLLFTVSDQGSGMSDEVKTRLFKPFANVGQQQAGQQGSGLGLTICKQLVEEMGGDISIDSKSGEGTRVRFTVPVERKAPTGDDVAANMPALRGRRVLALHNSPIIDQAICGYAMACGMCCEIAASEEEALDLLQAASRTDQPFAAAIIDSTMHDSAGLTLARRIRTTDEISLIPIVLLASISKPLEPGKVSSVGRIRCINKPILPSELLQSLQHLIENGRPAAANEVLTGNQVAESTERRVLVAEDNPVNRQVLTGMLESLGYAADCVEDGPTALEVLSERPYDIVLMDCQMPGMDGEQVTEKIRGDELIYSPQPVIVAVTADTSLEHRSKCLAAGMDDFIGKPVRIGKLKSGLERWMSMLVEHKDDADTTGQESARDNELLAQIQQRIGSQDELFLSRYIDLFLQDTTMRLQKLAGAMEERDAATIRRECHALKGACLEFGMSRMGRHCDDLRDSAASGNPDVIPQLLVVLQREFERIRPVLEMENAEKPSRSLPDR